MLACTIKITEKGGRMKTVIDQAALRRRASLSHAASLGGLFVLLGSVAITLFRPTWTVLGSVMLFSGFALAMVGIYYANRWVKKPRPEVILDISLKGLSDAHRLYHYTRLGDHILLTPNGVVALETVNLEGVFTYQKGRWKQKFSVSRALRFIVEERLGDPASAAASSVELVKRYLMEGAPEGLESQVGATPVQALVVFTHPNAQVVAKDAPIPVAQPDKLLKKIPHPGQKMAPELYQYIRGKLDALLPSSE